MNLLTPNLGLGLEIGFADHIGNVIKGLTLYNNIDTVYVSRIMNIDGVATHTDKVA